MRPKAPPVQPALLPSKSRRFSFVGIGQTRNPNLSEEAEEILSREIDRADGWTLQPLDGDPLRPNGNTRP